MTQNPARQEKRDMKVKRAMKELRGKTWLRVGKKASLKERATRGAERHQDLEANSTIQNLIWKKGDRLILLRVMMKCSARWKVLRSRESAREMNCARVGPAQKRVEGRGRTG